VKGLLKELFRNDLFVNDQWLSSLHSEDTTEREWEYGKCGRKGEREDVRVSRGG